MVLLFPDPGQVFKFQNERFLKLMTKKVAVLPADSYVGRVFSCKEGCLR